MTAISTYATLQAGLASAVNRDDLSTDITAFSPASIDGLIKQAITASTSSLQADLLARGGHKSMEALDDTLVTVAGTETVALPTTFGSAKTLTLVANGQDYIISFLDPTSLWTQVPTRTTGQPDRATIIGGSTLYLRKIPDAVYSLRLVYNQKLTALVNASDTNWLLTNHAHIYIGQGMVELSILLENDDRLQFWKGYVDQKVNDIMGDDRNVRWGALPSMPTIPVTIA